MPDSHRNLGGARRTVIDLIAVLVAAGFVLGIFTQFNHTDRTCKVVRGFVVRSNRTLPTLDYYKHHPRELKLALSENARLLRSLSFCG